MISDIIAEPTAGGSYLKKIHLAKQLELHSGTLAGE